MNFTLKRHAKNEPMGAAYVTILIAIGLQLLITNQFTIGPRYLVAGLELLLLFGVILASPNNGHGESRVRRSIAFLLITLVAAANAASLVIVCSNLIHSQNVSGHALLLSALAIYLTNIVMFSLWYWEMDCPGLTGTIEPTIGPDFLFPQTKLEVARGAEQKWTPRFFDYLYISITNATAFSPTDAMPLTHRAKFLMSLQAIISLITVVLVTARAVNILG